MSSLRQEAGRNRGLLSRPSREIRGDADARARSRVEEMACAGFEEQRQSVDGTGRLEQEVGFDAMGSQAQVGLLQRPGPNVGPSHPRSSGWAVGSGLASSYKEKSIPSQAHLIDSGLLLKACPPVFTGHSKGGNLELEFVRLREQEIGRR